MYGKSVTRVLVPATYYNKLLLVGELTVYELFSQKRPFYILDIQLINAHQSSTESEWSCAVVSCAANMAIDGNFGYGSVTDDLDGNSWWSAEFATPAKIKNIAIAIDGWAHHHCCYNSFKVETRMSTNENWNVCKGEHVLPYHSPHVVCDRPTKAKYLRLSVRDSPLYLYEVVVTGTNETSGM